MRRRNRRALGAEMINQSLALACEAATGGGEFSKGLDRDLTPAGFQRGIDGTFTDAARIETRASRLLAKARRLSERLK